MSNAVYTSYKNHMKSLFFSKEWLKSCSVSVCDSHWMFFHIWVGVTPSSSLPSPTVSLWILLKFIYFSPQRFAQLGGVVWWLKIWAWYQKALSSDHTKDNSWPITVLLFSTHLLWLLNPLHCEQYRLIDNLTFQLWFLGRSFKLRYDFYWYQSSGMYWIKMLNLHEAQDLEIINY